MQWNTCSGVCLNIVSRWTPGCQSLPCSRAGRAPGNGMGDHRGNLVGYSGLCVAVFQLSVTKHKREGIHNYILWNLWSLFFFNQESNLEKNTLPVAQGFLSWWAAQTSVAVLLGTGNEGLHSSPWRCQGSSPVHSSLQARWVVVCQETSVTGERHYLSSPMRLVCWFSDTVMVSVLLFNHFSYKKKTFC